MDIEQLILQLKDLSPDYSSPGILDELGHAPFDWEKGKNLDEARDLLRALVQSHDDLAAIRRLVQEYEAKTGKGGS